MIAVHLGMGSQHTHTQYKTLTHILSLSQTHAHTLTTHTHNQTNTKMKLTCIDSYTDCHARQSTMLECEPISHHLSVSPLSAC